MRSVTARPAARRSRLAWIASAVTLSATAAVALVGAAVLAQGVDGAPTPELTTAADTIPEAVVDADDPLDDDPDEPGESDDANEDAEELLVALPESTRVSLDRDPFRPVVEEPSITPGDPADPADPSDPADPDDPDDPLAPRDPSDPSDPDDPSGSAACTGGTELVCDGHVLTLDEVRTDDDGSLEAVITVDAATYVVGLGEVFASEFALHGIDGSCVTIFFSGESHRLCTAGTPMK